MPVRTTRKWIYRDGVAYEVDPKPTPKPSELPTIISDTMNSRLWHPASSVGKEGIYTDSKSTFDRITKEAGFECVGNEYKDAKWKQGEFKVDWAAEVEKAEQRMVFKNDE